MGLFSIFRRKPLDQWSFYVQGGQLVDDEVFDNPHKLLNFVESESANLVRRNEQDRIVAVKESQDGVVAYAQEIDLPLMGDVDSLMSDFYQTKGRVPFDHTLIEKQPIATEEPEFFENEQSDSIDLKEEELTQRELALEQREAALQQQELENSNEAESETAVVVPDEVNDDLETEPTSQAVENPTLLERAHGLSEEMQKMVAEEVLKGFQQAQERVADQLAKLDESDKIRSEIKGAFSQKLADEKKQLERALDQELKDSQEAERKRHESALINIQAMYDKQMNEKMAELPLTIGQEEQATLTKRLEENEQKLANLKANQAHLLEKMEQAKQLMNL